MKPPRRNQQTRGWGSTGWIHRGIAVLLLAVCLPVAQAQSQPTAAEAMTAVTALKAWAFAHVKQTAPTHSPGNNPWVYVGRWTVGHLYPVAYFRHAAQTGQLDRVFVMLGPDVVLEFDAQAHLLNRLSQLPFLHLNTVTP